MKNLRAKNFRLIGLIAVILAHFFRAIGLIATHDSGLIATHVSGLLTTPPVFIVESRETYQDAISTVSSS